MSARIPPPPRFGTVQWFDMERGYGFIAPDDGGDEIFVHFTGIAEVEAIGGRRNLHGDDRVQFDTETSKKNGKPEARNVRVVE